MDATGLTEHPNIGDREPVLDVVDRVCELCFGLFMALTFVGTVSAVGAGADAGHKMFYTALGCNLAWGLVDAVMFLVRMLVARGRRVTLARTVRSEPDAATGVRTLRDAMARWLRPFLGDTELESMRRRLAALPDLPQRAVFVRDEFLGAAGIFLLVVCATFPVALGHYAGFSGWQAGLAMAVVGILLTVAIILLAGFAFSRARSRWL